MAPPRRTRPSRGLRRAAALLVLLLIGGVSALAWQEVEEEPTSAMDGGGGRWAIWTCASILACLLAAVVFRRERELRIGVLQGVALGVVAAVAVLWLGLAGSS